MVNLLPTSAGSSTVCCSEQYLVTTKEHAVPGRIGTLRQRYRTSPPDVVVPAPERRHMETGPPCARTPASDTLPVPSASANGERHSHAHERNISANRGRKTSPSDRSNRNSPRS